MKVLNSYKPTVSALILNSKNQALLTHNKNHGPDFWKFPQGGLEPKESRKEAIMREMEEELGTKELDILKESSIRFKYEWPKEIQEKKGYKGPELTFFILRCKDEESLTPNKAELDRIKWVNLGELPSFFTTLPDLQPVLQKLINEARLLIKL